MVQRRMGCLQGLFRFLYNDLAIFHWSMIMGGRVFKIICVPAFWVSEAFGEGVVRLMEEILHHLGWLKPFK